MPKMALLDCVISEKCAVFMKDGAFALFFRPHPGGFDSSRDPPAGNLPFQAKKVANARGSARGGAGCSWKLLSYP